MTSRMRILLAAAAALWLTPAAGAWAQTQSEAIVVTGRTAENTQAFVETIAVAPGAANQLARWDTAICPSVAGLPGRQGQFLADRIAQRALAVGLAPGAPGCQGNVAVFVTNDSDTLAQRLFDENPGLFAYHGGGSLVTLGRGAFDDFLNTPRAVRWWHVAETVSADGVALHGDSSTGGMSNAPATRSQGTRLRNDVRQDFARVIIIVDASRVGGVQLAALGDYVAMVALAQVNPGADTSAFPTILNLFNGNEGLTEMTDWDLAYLDGLYSATRAAVSAQQQQREITRRMLERPGQG